MYNIMGKYLVNSKNAQPSPTFFETPISAVSQFHLHSEIITPHDPFHKYLAFIIFFLNGFK